MGEQAHIVFNDDGQIIGVFAWPSAAKALANDQCGRVEEHDIIRGRPFSPGTPQPWGDKQ